MYLSKKHYSPVTSRKYQNVYQIRAVFPLANDAGSLKKLVGAILEFYRKQYDVEWPNEAGKLQDFELDNDMRYRAKAVSIPERSLWALHLKYYDSEEHNSRWFYHEISMVGSDGGIEFGYRVYCDRRPGNNDVVFTPKLIFCLSDQFGLFQIAKLDGKPIVINAPMQVDELIVLLAYENRTLPVVVISEIYLKDHSAYSKAIRFLVDPAFLAQKTRGFAFVVQLSYESAREFSMRMGRSWAVFDGSIRTYYPNFDQETNASSEHPGKFKDQIQEYIYREKSGPEAYCLFLQNLVRQTISQYPVDWRDHYFFHEARKLKNELEGFFQWIDSKAAGDQKGLKVEVDKLTSELADAREELAIVKLERDEQAELNELYEKQAADLQATINAMGGFTQEALPPSPAEEAEDLPETAYPAAFPQIPDWVRRTFPGKLVLHPRAERALDKAAYFSVEIVCFALELLANAYRDSRLGIQDDSAFRAGCEKHNLIFRGAIKTMRNQEAKEEYYVNYPLNSQSKHFLKFKIERGRARDRRYCMRIYFFWHEESQMVVVGYLPDHLTNQLT